MSEIMQTSGKIRRNTNSMNKNVDDLNKKLEKYEKSKKTIKVFQLNAESMKNINRFSNLQSYIEAINLSLDIIVITETWLQTSDISPFNPYILNGFDFISQCRNGRGGGIVVYVNKKLDYEVIEIKSFPPTNPIDKAKIRVKLQHESLDIVSYYRPPYTSNISAFTDDLEQEMSQAGRKKMFIVGDINVNALTDQSFIEMINNYSFILSNNYATRPSTGSILDHVILNFYNCCLIKNHTVTFSASDHNAIISTVDLSKREKGKEKIMRTRINYERLNSMFMKNYNDESANSLLCFNKDVDLYFDKIIEITKKSVTDCSKSETFTVN